MDDEPEVTIRPATSQDADAIGRVHVASWRQAYAGTVPADFLADLSEAEQAEQWRQVIESGHGTLLVADDGNGDVLGFAMVGHSRDEDADPGTQEIYAIYFDPAAWGQGAARELMRTLLAELGAAKVTLWALADNARALHFYRRHGFSPDGVEKFEEIGGTNCLELRYRRG